MRNINKIIIFLKNKLKFRMIEIYKVMNLLTMKKRKRNKKKRILK